MVPRPFPATLRCAVATLVGCGALLSASPARAEPPIRTYYLHPPTHPPAYPDGMAPILFINRNGGTYVGGQQDDSTRNISAIVNGSGTIPPFSYGDAVWSNVLACVRRAYAPFQITVTDVDPGTQPHIENAVGGNPANVGFPQGYGGVASFNCAPIPNGISFTFAGVYGPDVEQICETIAQETAHTYGLDHEFYCPDFMTYLTGCGNKSFTDHDAQFGELSARSSMCGGATQNSYRTLLGILGARLQVAPTVAITAPMDGAVVAIGDPISATATDDVLVAKVELLWDGTVVATKTAAPYAFTVPQADTPGMHEVRVRATDDGARTAEAFIHVTSNVVCELTADCVDPSTICVGGQCVPGTRGATGNGAACAKNDECASAMCVSDVCVVSCNPGDACAAGFQCVTPDGGHAACLPSGGGNGATPGHGEWIAGKDPGCAVSSGRGSLAAAILCAAAMAGAIARRRRR